MSCLNSGEIQTVDMKWRKEFIRYIITGIGTNALGYCGFYLLVKIGLDPQLVISIIYIISISLAFVLNKQWSFSHSGNVASSAVRYVIVYFICYLLNMLAIDFFCKQQGYSPLIVQFIAVIVAAILIFFAQKFWVFRHRKITAAIL